MRPLVTESGAARWVDATECGLVREATVTLGADFNRPGSRRDYLAFLANCRCDSSGRPGSTPEEWSKRVRDIALHLDRRQIAASRRHVRDLAPQPAIRFPLELAA